MRRCLLVARFFWVAPVAPLGLVALMALGVAIATVLSLVAGPTGAALPGMLAVQIFSASSGVKGPARRGYYDSLLARGVSRRGVLFGHWCASVGPGVVCVSTVLLIERIADPTSGGSAGAVMALWLTSSLPWAATVALPRFAGAIGWVVAMVTAIAVGPDAPPVGGATSGHTPAAWTSLSALVFPMGLIDQPLGPAPWPALLPALGGSALAVLLAFVWFEQTDLPLEAAP